MPLNVLNVLVKPSYAYLNNICLELYHFATLKSLCKPMPLTHHRPQSARLCVCVMVGFSIEDYSSLFLNGFELGMP